MLPVPPIPESASLWCILSNDKGKRMKIKNILVQIGESYHILPVDSEYALWCGDCYRAHYMVAVDNLPADMMAEGLEIGATHYTFVANEVEQAIEE